MSDEKPLEWLLAGDPAIRWQVMRDLTGADAAAIAEERRVATGGWGARLLAHQDASGRWGGQLYNHKWLSTTYTLQLLHRMGLEPGNRQAHLGCKALLEGGFQADGSVSYAKTVAAVDNGVTGMVLSLLAAFDYPDERIHAIAGYLLGQQSPDGRWEPFPGNRQIRYTFDGTWLILEGLREYEKCHPSHAGPVAGAQKRGREFLLRHKLYKTDLMDEAIDKKITLFSFPPRWHYDVLVALDYFQDCRAEGDARLGDAIALLNAKQGRDGTWKLQNRHPGKTFFEMEAVGKPSRWNTLRALRVLKWWEG